VLRRLPEAGVEALRRHLDLVDGLPGGSTALDAERPTRGVARGERLARRFIDDVSYRRRLTRFNV